MNLNPPSESLISSRRRHRSGSWKIALADMMTVLFAFLLIMWVNNMIEPGERRVVLSAVTGESSRLSSSPGALDGSESPLKGEPSTPIAQTPIPPLSVERLLSAMGLSQDSEHVQVEKIKDGYMITVSSDWTFKPGRAVIENSVIDKLRSLGAVLGENSSMLKAIVISGHTDNTPIRTFQYPSNWELSAARAASVARLFEEEEVPHGLLRVVGYADTKPKFSNDLRLLRAKNRRVEIKVIEKQ